jgi:uncharacterized repeat protein (TIGR03803 family)
MLVLVPSAAWEKVTERVLLSFTGGNDGSTPAGILTFDNAGNLYGIAVDGGASKNGVVFELTPTKAGHWTETELYSFTGGSDGAGPEGGVIFDKAGNLYGVTTGGGGNGCSGGCGTVFELTPGKNGLWTESVLYSFTGGSDGGAPDSILIFDAAGNLYGTTDAGGDKSCDLGDSPGCGTVFELTPAKSGPWTEKVLHAFVGGDGAFPLLAGVIFDGAGNLYGTTSLGGRFSEGTVFELAAVKSGQWKETVLHAFKGGNDGAGPGAGLAFDSAGALYGTTYGGGSQSCPCGTVFKLTPVSQGHWAETIIHKFVGSDGIGTFATPIFDKAGNLYGTAFDGGGGVCDVCGTAFELTPTPEGPWQETVLHDFGARRGDAGTPLGGLILDKAGRLYGTSELGGNDNVGAVYMMAP